MRAQESPAEPTRRSVLIAGASAFAGLALEPSLVPFARLASGAELGVAVVGLGRQGRALLGELQKISGVRVAAVCDDDEERLQGGARRVQGAASYASATELLEREAGVEAVFIATPTHLHEPIALAAIAAGKHVFCESPLAATLEAAQNIARAARGSQRVFQVGFQGRSNPVYALARSFHRAGATGETCALSAQSFRKTSWRTPGRDAERDRALNWRLDPEVSTGLAGEIAAQQLDVLHWFLSRYPISVRGMGGVQHWRDGREVADTIACQFRFADGAVLSYQASLANSYGGTFELLAGDLAAIKLAWTHGWMFKEADAPTLGWEVYANRQQFHNDEGITLIADATKLAAQDKLKEGVGLPESPLFYALADFLRSVTEGAPVACSVEEGLRATAVGLLANRAVTSAAEIAIDEAALRVD